VEKQSVLNIECAFVTLVIQHADRLFSVAWLFVPQLYTLSHNKRQNFLKKFFFEYEVCSDFSTTFV
jgi:hypothetical protein